MTLKSSAPFALLSEIPTPQATLLTCEGKGFSSGKQNPFQTQFLKLFGQEGEVSTKMRVCRAAPHVVAVS